MKSRDQLRDRALAGEAAAADRSADKDGSRSRAPVGDRPGDQNQSGTRAAIVLLRLLAAAGLAVDAFVHVDLAGRFAAGGTLSESRLFLIQGSLAAAAALGIVVRGRRLEAAFGFLVAAAALGAVLLYRFVDVGALGPLPNMYEPIWYTEKAVSAVAEGVAVVACLALFALRRHQWSGHSVPRRR